MIFADFFNTKSEEKKGEGEKNREKISGKKSAPFGEQTNLICFTLKSFCFATVFATVFCDSLCDSFSVARNFA